MKPEPVIVTVEPTGPLVGLMLVIDGGAVGLTVGVGDGAGDALATGVGEEVGVGRTVGAFEPPPEQAAIFATSAKNGNNRNRLRESISHPRPAVASPVRPFLRK